MKITAQLSGVNRPLSVELRLINFWSGVSAAIDCQVRAGDVGRFGTCDECHHRGDILNMSIALQRGHGLLRYRPITRGGVQIRLDGAGLNVIDSNAPAPQLPSQSLCK